MKRTELRRSDGKDRASMPFKFKRCAKTKGGCGLEFPAVRQMQAACSPLCAQRMAELKRQKAERKADAAKREAMKKQPEWVAIAQEAFNRYIRKRDAGKPCICCGKYSSGAAFTGGDWDAGHYRSRGAAPDLRFDERNVHAQLKQCNHRAWDVATYRANLIERIGLAEVEALEGPHPPRKYTVSELKALRDHYRQKAKELG